MKITKEDNAALHYELIHSLKCGWCNKPTPQGCDPAHLIGNAAGGSFLRCNMIAICRNCHSTSHNANSGNQQHPNPKDLLKKVAQREKVSPEQIRAIVWFISRLDKHDSRERIEEKIDNWEAGQMVKWIVRRELVEAGKL